MYSLRNTVEGCMYTHMHYGDMYLRNTAEGAPMLRSMLLALDGTRSAGVPACRIVSV